MKKLSDLYTLIQSLTKNEKSYFKKYTSIYTNEQNSIYLRIFDSIEKQVDKGIYDDNSLKKIFAKEKFINHLPVIKVYLYKIILKALNSYYAESTISIKLKRDLINVEILFNKGLYKQSYKQLIKIKELATKYDEFNVLNEIIWTEVNLIKHNSKASKFYTKITSLKKQELDLRKKLININEYKWLEYEMFICLYKHGISRDGKPVNEAKKIMSHRLLKNESEALTFSAKKFFYHIHCTYYHLVQDQEKNAYYLQKIVKLYDQNSYVLEEYMFEYIVMLQSLTYMNILLNKYKNFKDNIAHLLELNKSYLTKCSEREKSILMFRYYNLVFSPLLEPVNLGKKKEEILLEAENFYKRNEKYVNTQERIIWQIKMCIQNFKLKKYEKALEILNSAINSFDKDNRIDIYCSIRIFHLIIHYELKNFELLEYIIKSTYRFLQKKEKVYKLEKLFFTFFKKISASYKQEALINSFKELRYNLLKLKLEPSSQASELLHLILDWVNIKLENK